MKQGDQDLGIWIAHFREILEAVREAVGENRIEFFRGTQEELSNAMAFILLFRTLNLAQSAIECAERRRHEAVALIARSMIEIKYIVGCLGSNLEFADEYMRWSSQRRCRELERLHGFLLTENEKDEGLAQRLKALLEREKSEATGTTNWEDQTRQLAKRSGKEYDYLYRYSFLCVETHHRGHALMRYAKECKDGVEIHQQSPETDIQLFLGLAIMNFSSLAPPLLELCGIPATERLGKALLTAKHYLEERSKGMQGPKTL